MSALAGSLPGTMTAPSTREAILDAAERHFAVAGFAGASLREITADAGLKNQASLYHYFDGKRALYDAVVARAVEAILPAFAGGGNDATAIGASLGQLLDYLAERPHVARLIERAGLEDDAIVRAVVETRLRPLFDAGVRVLREAGAGWPEAELPHLAAGLYHLIFGYFAAAPLLGAVMGNDPYAPAALARQRRFLIDAVAALVAPGGVPSVPRSRSTTS